MAWNIDDALVAIWHSIFKIKFHSDFFVVVFRTWYLLDGICCSIITDYSIRKLFFLSKDSVKPIVWADDKNKRFHWQKWQRQNQHVVKLFWKYATIKHSAHCAVLLNEFRTVSSIVSLFIKWWLNYTFFWHLFCAWRVKTVRSSQEENSKNAKLRSRINPQFPFRHSCFILFFVI